jgi:phosphoenolpyruvate synthase/pyruvate phosphate dikinase
MLNLYQRFLMDFGKVVYGIDAACYQNVINNQLMESKLSKIEDFSISDLQKIVIKFKDLADVPSDPYRQLELIIIASIKSWHDSKNVQLRRENGLADANNAITIQSMVYGNLNQRSGNGVCTTRNTITGSPELVGAYTVMCEGEDTVTSKPFFDLDFIKHDSPACYADLVQSVKLIEKHFKDAQTVDFTIENGHLYILKTSTAKREPSAAIKIATDMVNNNVLSEREAIMRIDPNSISADGICANVIAWAMKFKRLDVYCKVSSIAEAKQAFSLYADGVELECSQLLMTENRIDYLRKFILTDCPIEREETVGVIMSMLEGDLKELFIPYGVHKRIILHTLSDIPWNTLCPTRSACLQSDSHSMCCKADDGSYNPNNLTLVLNKVLIKVVIGVVTSLFSDGIMIRSPELMMNHSNEVNQLQLLINTVGEALNGNKASTYVRFGIQLKSPRSCILADSLPLQNIDFLSIDTEKLTSAAIGDDEFDSKKPTLDLRGVGFLIQYAARKLRKGNPVTKLGCNGCFAQDPTSILFMDELGLDYITVDGTNRLPCAIIAAAQSHILSVTKQKEMEDSEYVFWLNLDNQLF